jgi:hypothetical protein
MIGLLKAPYKMEAGFTLGHNEFKKFGAKNASIEVAGHLDELRCVTRVLGSLFDYQYNGSVI